jgi:hypothetical protein
LQEAGFVVARNVFIEHRLADGRNDRRHAEATFEASALATGERGLPAIRPSEGFSAVVGGKHDDGVVVERQSQRSKSKAFRLRSAVSSVRF